MTQDRDVTTAAASHHHRWRWTAVLLAVLFGSQPGCSSGDPVTPADGPGPSASPATESDAVPPVKPADKGPSPEQRAAEAAFRTITTENVPVEEWEAAYQKLQGIGKPALPILIEALQSDDQVRREMASTFLAWFGIEAESVANELIAALDDKSTFVRTNVATALLQMPDHVDRVIPVLSEYLQCEDADLRRMAATNLAAIDSDKVRPLLGQLIVALDDKDRDVVYYSVQLLGRIGPDSADALPKLKAINADDDIDLKSAVTTAILLIDPDHKSEVRPPATPGASKSGPQ